MRSGADYSLCPIQHDPSAQRVKQIFKQSAQVRLSQTVLLRVDATPAQVFL